jgi:hypothetical protein
LRGKLEKERAKYEYQEKIGEEREGVGSSKHLVV